MTNSREQLSAADLRKFGLVTAGMLVLFFDILIPWIWEFSPPIWPLALASGLILMGTLVPTSLAPVYRIWMAFAEVLGWVNTRIILGLIFFLFFLPFGIVMRVFKDPMRRKLDNSTMSYRIESESPKQENLERPF